MTAVNDRIRALIADHPVMLFMKGTPAFPICGFSAAVVEILKRRHVAFEAVDVLEDSSLRQGIKEFSRWPTIPQLFVRGEFVGGCDIIREMDAASELDALFDGFTARGVARS